MNEARDGRPQNFQNLSPKTMLFGRLPRRVYCSTLMLSAYGISHVGLVRKTNEDSFLADLDLGLFCVADGMGGHNAGEVASRLTVDVVRDCVARSRDPDAFAWPFGIDRRVSHDANRLATSIRLANLQVLNDSEERAEYAGMGTTIVAALVRGHTLTYIGIGDSRLYSYREGRLTQLTRDDSWVALVLERENGLSTETLSSHPMRHVLTSVVGIREELTVDVAERELSVKEVLLLSSDGLHGSVSDAVIASVLGSEKSLEAAARQLVQEALARGGTDNVTAVLVRCDPD